MPAESAVIQDIPQHHTAYLINCAFHALLLATFGCPARLVRLPRSSRRETSRPVFGGRQCRSYRKLPNCRYL